MSTVEILKAARAKIADEKHWTQGEIARDIAGKFVNPYSSNAVCWCATGAVVALDVPVGHQRDALKLLDAATSLSEYFKGLRPIAYYNDHHNHAEVLDVYGKAIAQLGAA